MDNSFNDISICIVGLGYVGLPLARLFSSRYPTIGFDQNQARVDAINAGRDTTCELPNGDLRKALCCGLCCTTSVDAIRPCNVYIVAVPTPVDANNRPDLAPLLEASRTVGSVLGKGDLVIYESTVYPGVTEEECVPMLAQTSGLTFNRDFFVGYSPERVNPGDHEHTVERIVKVTSGSTPETAQFVDQLYNSVLLNGTHPAPSIKVAEASKIIENAQRDVNIAFMNELAKIFNAMGIDTGDVLAAAATKWNFIPMKPGLVGGHCIGVDPYYLIQKAQVYGVMPRIMSNARRLNVGMGDYVAQQTIRAMNLKGLLVKEARFLIMGFAFKENCPDIRNSKVLDIYHTLCSYSSRITILDPWVDAEVVRNLYGVEVVPALPDNECYDAAILAVAHRQFYNTDWRKYVPQPGVIYDVKGILPRTMVDARL